MQTPSHREILLNAVAVSFPFQGPQSGIAELTRAIARCYSLSFHTAADDPMISQHDLKIEVGNRRRSYINKVLCDYAIQYPNQVEWSAKMQGQEGFNNRMELEVGNFLVTHHHHTKSDAMPEAFINLRSQYSQWNSTLNDPLQPEFFAPSEVVNPSLVSRLLNLVILHERSPESLQEVGRIEFVFPQNSRKLIVLEPAELVERQNYLRDLCDADLFDFKRRSNDQIRKIIG